MSHPAMFTWIGISDSARATLQINNFDANGPYGPLNVSGRMAVPGELANSATNKFSGPLARHLGLGAVPQPVSAAARMDHSLPMALIRRQESSAIGASETTSYKATGIFGAGRVGAVNPDGHLEPPPNFALSSGPGGN